MSKVPDFDEAGRLFGLAAASGVGEASYHLGVMFEYGLISDSTSTPATSGEPISSEARYSPDFGKARKMYEEAWEEHKVAEAGYHLALMHAYGRGVPQSAPKGESLLLYFGGEGGLQYLLNPSSYPSDDPPPPPPPPFPHS